MKESYIFDGIRTPFGRYGGILSSLRPDEMMSSTMIELISRYPQVRDQIEDVIIGDSNQAGEDSRNIARNALLLAGLPYHTPGVTVNRLCGSGLSAAIQVNHAIRSGEGDLFIAGGVESMTRAPFVMAKTEKAFNRSVSIADSTIGWRFPNNALISQYGSESMPETAENIARVLNISREESDQYAYDTQVRYENARISGFYDQEIMSLKVPGNRKNQPPILAKADEHPRPDTTLEKLSTLKPLHEGGIVTAGNASGVNDGAAALLIGNESAANQFNLKPKTKILATAVTGVEPGLMGLGPVSASQKALKRARLSLNDMDLIEINEAFAVQVLGCLKELKLDYNDIRINPNGGAIAIGHPLGASGSRLLLTASRELNRRNGKYALVTLCIGIGQGVATIIESVNS